MENDRGGRYFEIRMPEVPMGSFWICRVKDATQKEGDNDFSIKPSDLEVMTVGDSGDTLMGWGIVRNENCKGQDVAMVFNPNEHIIYPSGNISEEE